MATPKGYAFYEHLLLLSPDQKVNAEIMEIKTAYSKDYGLASAPRSKPHITLANFGQFESMEKPIVEGFEKLAKAIPPTTIKLSGFGQFNYRTIYINVMQNKPIAHGVSAMKLRLAKKMNALDTFKPSFTSNLHLTIARNIAEPQFKQAWEEWGKRRYSASFPVNGMLLMKREIDPVTFKPKESYRLIKYFPFTGKEAEAEQLNLFK